MNRFVEPEELATLIAWLASEECLFTTGGGARRVWRTRHVLEGKVS
jgi:NAD(P)-dependent dehydrogenase (short-subunit alcohol dehydrogenase family)